MCSSLVYFNCMKRISLVFLLTLPLIILAQNSTEAVKTVLNESLSAHVVKLYPKKTCGCNDCAHSYTKGLRITRHQEIQGTLRVWGLAKVSYRNARTGGNDAIQFYAEIGKKNGDPVVTKLRWRTDDCMKFETLYAQ